MLYWQTVKVIVCDFHTAAICLHCASTCSLSASSWPRQPESCACSAASSARRRRSAQTAERSTPAVANAASARGACDEAMVGVVRCGLGG